MSLADRIIPPEERLRRVIHEHYEPRLWLAITMLQEDGRMGEFHRRLGAVTSADPNPFPRLRVLSWRKRK